MKERKFLSALMSIKKAMDVVAVVEGIIAKKWRTVASPDKLAEQLRRPASWGVDLHCL